MNPSLTAGEIATNIETAINIEFLGFTSVSLEDGKVAVHDPRIAAPLETILSTANAPSLSVLGRAGVGVSAAELPHVAIPFLPSSTYDAVAVAAQIAAAVETASAPALVTPVPDGSQLSDQDFEVVNDAGTLYVFEWDDVTVDSLPPLTVDVNSPVPGFNAPDPDCQNTQNHPAGSICILVPFLRGTSATFENDNGDLFVQDVPESIASENATELSNAITERVNFAPLGTPAFVTSKLGFSNFESASVIVSLYDLEATADPIGDKVVVNGRAPLSTSQLFTPGTAPINSLPIAGLIRTQEFTFDAMGNDRTADQIGRDVATSFSEHLDYSAGGSFARINFHGAGTADFSGIQVDGQALWVDVGSTPGVAVGNERIESFASDTSTADVPMRIADAINDALGPNITAWTRDQFVDLSFGAVTSESPLTAAGEGPGGIITGLAVVSGRMFAVSDHGGFYLVNDPTSADATTTYIANSSDDLVGIRFAGLTAGPPNVENGRYANLLFAVDDNGRVYAIDLPISGQEQNDRRTASTDILRRCNECRYRPDQRHWARVFISR